MPTTHVSFPLFRQYLFVLDPIQTFHGNLLRWLTVAGASAVILLFAAMAITGVVSTVSENDWTFPTIMLLGWSFLMAPLVCVLLSVVVVVLVCAPRAQSSRRLHLSNPILLSWIMTLLLTGIICLAVVMGTGFAFIVGGSFQKALSYAAGMRQGYAVFISLSAMLIMVIATYSGGLAAIGILALFTKKGS